MRKATLFCVMLTLCSCSGNRQTLLPNISGKAGEVIVVMDKSDWESTLGNSVRDLLACDCPYLPQKEPLYSLANVTPTGFTELFRVHRNIVFMDINPQVTKASVALKKDVWAAPQCMLQVSAPDAETADSLIHADGAIILASIEQAERERVIRNSMLYEEKSIAESVNKVFGGSAHFPTGYKLRKITDDFAWIADDKQFTTQGIFVYKYPAAEADNFTLENIIAKRNEILKDNVPGMFDNTYMITTDASVWEPSVEYLKFRGRDFAQVRGLWEVQNDYMGGPFVSHSFYSQDGKDIIVLDAFVYAPKYDKRQYLRQTESILYSWEWADNTAK